MDLGKMVWDRRQTGADELSERSYIFAVSAFTVGGLLLSAFTASLSLDWHPSWISFILFGLVMPIAGIIIAAKSDEPLVSLIGYVMVVVGLGALIGPSVATFKTAIVYKALMATGAVTVLMSFVGIAYPRAFLHWGSYLFAGLMALIAVRIGQIIALSFGLPATTGWMILVEYAGAVLFSALIIYDWNRAMTLDKTLDNAIDSAVGIYLDIANLFLHLLSIFGGGSKD